MLSYLKKETNYTLTENGATARATTGSDLLNFFSQAGAMRNRSDSDVINEFTKAFAEDKLLALKSLFYFRDIREGQGERRLFRVIAKYLAEHHYDVMAKNMHLIPEFGRWDDLYVFFGTRLQDVAGKIIISQFNKDLHSDSPSLLGKWLASENASSQETKMLAIKTRNILGLPSRQYRKALTALRKKISIVESKMSNNDWHEIDFEKVPSQASLKYRTAFYKHLPERYSAYLDRVTSGDAKVNTKTLYPYQLVNKVDYRHGYGYGYNSTSMSAKEEQLLDVMWENLPDYIGDKKENSIAVVDTSGSMWGTPIEVAISLGMYMAERNHGEFHNHFITFSTNPTLQEIKGTTFCERVRNLSKANWDGSTNVKAVFNLILNTAIKNKLPQDEMIDKVYIISDMEFDNCNCTNDGFRRGISKTLFETIGEEYARHGYNMPKLVFWNVDARNNQFPVTVNDAGVQLVSGFSPTLFEQIMNGKEAYELMFDILNSSRYEQIEI